LAGVSVRVKVLCAHCAAMQEGSGQQSMSLEVHAPLCHALLLTVYVCLRVAAAAPAAGLPPLSTSSAWLTTRISASSWTPYMSARAVAG
jgi:hypothetical protein